MTCGDASRRWKHTPKGGAITHRIHIRVATSGDAPAIVTVLQKSFATYEHLYTTEAYRATVPPPPGILERMEEGPLWVALLDDAVVGTASAVVTEEGCYIRGMGVIPDARGHRIGWKLLEAIDRFAHEGELTRLYLSTTPFLDRAIRLYERYGFRRTDDGPFDLHGTPLFTMEKPVTASRDIGPTG